jgi:Glycosyltransferase 61
VVLHSPLTSRVARRVLGLRPIEEACTRSVEVCPTTTVAPPPKPLYLEHELDRVTASDTSLEQQWEWLEGTTEYAGVTAYQLPPMWMVDGNLARGRSRFEMNANRERLLPSGTDLPEIVDGAFVSSVSGNVAFAHHIIDNLPTALLGPEFGVPHFVNPPEGLTPQVLAYRRMTDLEHPTVWTAHTKNCWVFRDIFLTDSKVRRLQELRARVAPQLPTPTGGSRVFLHRGDDGQQRAPSNQAEVEAALVAEGWLVLEPIATDLDALLAAISGAEIVMGVEGSHLAHLFYALAPGRTVLALMPPHRFNLLLKDYCDRLDLRFGFHVGVQREDAWEIDLPGLLRLVDRAQRAGPH